MKDYNRDFFKLSFDKEDTLFYVNEKKKTVTCKLRCVLYPPFAWDSPVQIPTKCFSIVATTKCCDSDVFDAERGKRIAMAKAENKAYTQAASYLFDYLNHLLFFQTAMRKFFDKTDHQCEHNEGYIDMISNPKNPNYKEELKGVKNGVTIVIK
jgi:hypothetical protein